MDLVWILIEENKMKKKKITRLAGKKTPHDLIRLEGAGEAVPGQTVIRLR